MENKSKLSRLALTRVMLQALLLLLAAPTSALAATEANQEIGIPQPMETRAKGCFGVVLSPDGDGFYSLRDGLLTHYQIAPFKKIGSIAIDLIQLNDRLANEQCEVLITNNGSKLILVYREWIVVLDRSKGKLINKLERRGELKSGVLEASTVNENDLVILNQFSEGGHENGRVWFQLSVLDINTLQLKKQIPDLGQKFEFYYSAHGGLKISKIQGKTYLSTGRSLAVLNSKTYEPELTLSCPRGITQYQYFWTTPMASKDYQKLYAVKATFVNDYLTHTQKDYGELEDNAVLIFDQATRQFSRETTDRQKEAERQRRRDLYDPFMFSRAPSRNKDYVTGSLWTYAVIANRNANIDYYFYPYESGDAILVEIQFPESKRIYHLTPNARQYLTMKNREGKVVPINDATFEKYRADSAR